MAYRINRSTLLSPLFAAGVILTGAATAWAAPPHFGGGFGGGSRYIDRMATELGLSELQRSDLERIADDNRKRIQPYVQQMKEGHQAMRELIEADEFNEAAVREAVENQSGVLTEMMILHARKRYEIEQLLTPEQREKMAHRRRNFTTEE